MPISVTEDVKVTVEPAHYWQVGLSLHLYTGRCGVFVYGRCGVKVLSTSSDSRCLTDGLGCRLSLTLLQLQFRCIALAIPELMEMEKLYQGQYNQYSTVRLHYLTGLL